MHIYEGHMGNLYVTEEELSDEETYCTSCGDSDWLACVCDENDYMELINSIDISVDKLGGWSSEYVREFVNETFGTNFNISEFNNLVKSSQRYAERKYEIENDK